MESTVSLIYTLGYGSLETFDPFCKVTQHLSVRNRIQPNSSSSKTHLGFPVPLGFPVLSLTRHRLKDAGDRKANSPGQHESFDSHQPAPLIKEDDFQKACRSCPADLGRPRNPRTAESWLAGQLTSWLPTLPMNPVS